MIHVPLKKRFKLYETNRKKGDLQDGRKPDFTSRDSDKEENRISKSSEVYSVSLHQSNSPLGSDGSPESPLTPASCDSTEKCLSWTKSSSSFQSHSSPSSGEERNAGKCPPRPTAFKPYNGKKMPIENCTIEYRSPNITDYSSHMSVVRLNTSSFFSHVPFCEGAQSVGLSTETEQVLEKSSCRGTQSKYTNGHRTCERNLKNNGLITNSDTIAKETKGRLSSSSSDLRIKQKFGDSSLVKDEYYWDKRRRNNASAKRSRDARRSRELETQINFALLHEENRKLKAEVTLLREENANLRGMICASQLSAT